jgi:DNA mismatch endonuclease (patch repair protein)
MTDVLTPSQRSFNMSRIRSRWTRQERELHAHLKARKIRHRMHPVIPGKPDALLLPDVAVFLHGCFWHGCRRCYVPPKTREEYWLPKIEGNRRRDRRNARAARRAGFRVLQVWEHDLVRGYRPMIENALSLLADAPRQPVRAASSRRRY